MIKSLLSQKLDKWCELSFIIVGVGSAPSVDGLENWIVKRGGGRNKVAHESDT